MPPDLLFNNMKKIILSLFVAIVLISPVFASAEMTHEEQVAQIIAKIDALQLELKIQMLLEQIASLQAQINSILAQQANMGAVIDKVQTDTQQIVQNTTPVPPPAKVYGCMDKNAKNYNPLAEEDNGNCEAWPILKAICSAVLKKESKWQKLSSEPDTWNMKYTFTATAQATGGNGNYTYAFGQSGYKMNNIGELELIGWDSLENYRTNNDTIYDLNVGGVSVKSGNQEKGVPCYIDLPPLSN